MFAISNRNSKTKLLQSRIEVAFHKFEHHLPAIQNKTIKKGIYQITDFKSRINQSTKCKSFREKKLGFSFLTDEKWVGGPMQIVCRIGEMQNWSILRLAARDPRASRNREKSSRNTQSNRAEQGKERERKSRKMKEKLRLTKRSLLTSMTCTILAISNIKDDFLKEKRG